MGIEAVLVTLKEAARACSMTPATYSKYAAKGLLPRANAVGKVSVEALRRAALSLHGIKIASNEQADAAERALREWESWERPSNSRAST